MNDQSAKDNGLQAATALLRSLANVLEQASAEDIAALLEGRATLSCEKKNTSINKVNKKYVPITKSPAPSVDLTKIANELQTLNSREEGASLLQEKALTRKNLEKLSRILKTSVLKSDNIDRITKKIIEATIGSRLNSAAIRGHDKP